MNALVPTTNAEAYKASTDAAGLCRDIVIASAMEIQQRRYVKVEGWQADKLARFTVTLAARLYREPGTVDGRRWRSESGPDFSVAGPVGGVLSPALLGLLDGSGLRRLAVRARPSGGGRSVLA